MLLVLVFYFFIFSCWILALVFLVDISMLQYVCMYIHFVSEYIRVDFAKSNSISAASMNGMLAIDYTKSL